MHLILNAGHIPKRPDLENSESHRVHHLNNPRCWNEMEFETTMTEVGLFVEPKQ
jgi:hypothetical protein